MPLAGTSVTLNDTLPVDHKWNFAAVEIVPMQRVPAPITWPVPSDIVYGALLSAAQLNATTSAAAAGVGTFVYSPPAGTKPGAGLNQTLSVTFIPTDTTTIYSQATATVPLNVLKATPIVTWSPPADIVYGTALSVTQLNATASVPGTFVYTPVAGTVLLAGTARTLSVTFTPAEGANYTAVTKSVAITVTKATPVITWATPANIVYGTALARRS